MKKGFTLLELLIVIIIIGVLAVVALTQYKDLSERARMSEAKSVIGAIRTAERIYHSDAQTFTPNIDDLSPYISVPPNPGTGCNTTHWFQYSVTGSGDAIRITAARCLEGDGGKSPDGDCAYSLILDEDEPGTQIKSMTGCKGTNPW